MFVCVFAGKSSSDDSIVGDAEISGNLIQMDASERERELNRHGIKIKEN